MKKSKNIKAIIVSVVIHVLILLGFFWVKLKNDIPEQEFGGIAIEFIDEISPVVQIAKNSNPVSEKEQKELTELDNAEEIAKQNLLLQEQKTIELQRKKEEERKKKKKKLTNILDNLDEESKEKVDTKDVSPDKLDINSNVFSYDGDFKKTTAFAKNGNGKQTGFFLGKRAPLKQMKPPYKCKGSAVVVVEIVVSPNGKTLHVLAGVEGSNYTEDCFRKEAHKAALNTQWTPNPNAKHNERGFVVYHFNTI